MPATRTPVLDARRAEMNEWIERNPLRRWRKSAAMPLAEVSSRLGVGITAIKYWEWGTSRPIPENMQRIGRLIGAVASVDARWTRWYNQRPQ